ncbi:Transposase IS116/IS110/IS902 family (plasmid) [Hoeflea sp. IMCC20628]|nr:Transposase IS116/IS110/IS902 family [Hoeflea sp. IMCC20628]
MQHPRELRTLLDDPDINISPRMRTLISDMADELDKLNVRIGTFDAEIKGLTQSDPAMKRLTEIPGVGPMTASALVAAIGDGQAFGKGRDRSAWLGLVPRQISTGGKVPQKRQLSVAFSASPEFVLMDSGTPDS